MNDSILNTIKQMLGITTTQTEFDTDIIIHINTVINILHQLGIFHSENDGYSITGTSEKWSDYLTDINKLQMVKTYVYLKVKLIFDPPLNATVISSMKEQIAELEFRLLENHNDFKVE